MIIPSIDIMGGRAVQLRQGKDLVLTSEKSPLELAKEFGLYGEVAVIDLDAALGAGDNRELVKELCQVAEVRAGGGVRSLETARELLKAGAKKVIIGTAAEPELLKNLPADRIMVALDQVDGKVVDNGWKTETGESVISRAQRLSPYCGGFLSTFVKIEGSMQGIDQEQVIALRDQIDKPLTIAGGVCDTSEAVSLTKLGVDVQVGMGLYKGNIELKGVVLGSLNWPSNKLLPTIVQDTFGNVLMMAYSSPESLAEALTNRQGVYFSRSRNCIWRKGETSGSTQTLLSVRSDCDNDCIIFTVQQKKVACHTGSYTCFSNSQQRPFGMENLFEIINERIQQETQSEVSSSSYTRQLFNDRSKLNKKIMEEAYEVVSYSSKDNLKWEIADLLYFVSVLACAEGISWKDVINELGGRAK